MSKTYRDILRIIERNRANNRAMERAMKLRRAEMDAKILIGNLRRAEGYSEVEIQAEIRVMTTELRLGRFERYNELKRNYRKLKRKPIKRQAEIPPEIQTMRQAMTHNQIERLINTYSEYRGRNKNINEVTRLVETLCYMTKTDVSGMPNYYSYCDIILWYEKLTEWLVHVKILSEFSQ